VRYLATFVLGVIAGLSVEMALAQDRRIAGVALNHVMVRVPNVEEAKKFYADKFGFRETFSFAGADGTPDFTYLQISRDTFLELMPAAAGAPAGVGHIGLEVSDLKATINELRRQGLTVPDATISERTKAHLSSVPAAPGVIFELLEFPSDSLVGKAKSAWRPTVH